MENTELDDSGKGTESSETAPILKAESAKPGYTVRSSSDYKKLSEKRSSATVLSIVLAGIAVFAATAAWWMFDQYPTLTMTELETMLEYPFMNLSWDQILTFILLSVVPTVLTWFVVSTICYKARNRRHYLVAVRVCALLCVVCILVTAAYFIFHYDLMGMNRPFINLIP